MNVKKPLPERAIQISAVLREVVAIEINLKNPLNQMIQFTVNIIGDGLFGEEYIVLDPLEIKTYTLHFSPTKIGQHTGSIFFINEIVGEFWYQLNLNGKPPQPVKLKDMICSVGNTCVSLSFFFLCIFVWKMLSFLFGKCDICFLL